MNISTASLALREGVDAAQARQFERARPLLQQATTESPENVVAWFWLAIASPSAESAIACLRRVLAIDASHQRAREVLATMLSNEAHAVAAAGDRDQARALAAEATDLRPDEVVLGLGLAGLADDPSSRIDVLRRAAEAVPDHQQLRDQLRRALLARGVTLATADRGTARESFREAAALNPADVRVWLALANLAESRDEWVAALRQLLHAAPDHQYGRRALGAALADDAREAAAAGRVDDACEHWRESISVSGGHVDAWLELAAITPDPAEARLVVETAYEHDPTDERVIAARDRMRGPQIDPAAVEPPADAFARFAPVGAVDGAEPTDDPLAQIESILDDRWQAARPYATSAAAPAPPIDVAPIDVAPTRRASTAPIDVALIDALIDVALIDLGPIDIAPINVAPINVAPIDFGPIHVAPIDVPPVVVSPAVALAPAAAPPPAAAATTASPRHTVMIVDDSPTIRKILGLSLEREGYRVIAEPDGESAIERLAHVVPDVILLDIAMPKLDGYEVCKRIKQSPRTAAIPVVMLSGKGAFFDQVKGHMAGATEYLTKPFETPAVLAVVSRVCQAPVEVAHG